MDREQQWRSTRLWQNLEAREAQDTKRTLENCLPDIEQILKSGATAALDFTLHDEEHSFRVAQRIASLLPHQKLDLLSDLEIALLLLASYLHDIGMTPTRDRTSKHWQFIVTGQPGLLDPSEEKELQKWLDFEHSGTQPPVARGNLTSAGIDLADELFSYYCRHKHNDWSEDWIRNNLFNE